MSVEERRTCLKTFSRANFKRCTSDPARPCSWSSHWPLAAANAAAATSHASNIRPRWSPSIFVGFRWFLWFLFCFCFFFGHETPPPSSVFVGSKKSAPIPIVRTFFFFNNPKEFLASFLDIFFSKKKRSFGTACFIISHFFLDQKRFTTNLGLFQQFFPLFMRIASVSRSLVEVFFLARDSNQIHAPIDVGCSFYRCGTD